MRRDEIAEGYWNEVDLRRGPGRSLGENEEQAGSLIPLTKQQSRSLRTAARWRRIRPSSSRRPSTPISGWSRVKDTTWYIGDSTSRPRRRETTPRRSPAAWTFHDLQTVATNMQKLGVKLEVTEAVLNHVLGSRAGIVGIYQRHDFGRREARCAGQVGGAGGRDRWGAA